MNLFARFNENPAMILQDIKETKRYRRTDNVKTVNPLQTKFAGGINITSYNKENSFAAYTKSKPQGYKTFVMLHSTEHKISKAH